MNATKVKALRQATMLGALVIGIAFIAAFTVLGGTDRVAAVVTTFVTVITAGFVGFMAAVVLVVEVE